MISQQALVLYTFHNSVCTQKVLITLREKNLKYKEKQINLFAAEQFDPEYLTINPKGVVPTLIHNSQAITESTLICEYIDEVWPNNRLIPEDPFLRTRMREFSKIVDEGIFEATRELSFSAMFRKRMRDLPEKQRRKRIDNVGDPNKRARLLSTFELGVDSPYVFQAIGNWEKAFKHLNGSLEQFGGKWLLGQKFTLADINLAPFLWRMEFLNLIDLWMENYPKVQAWWNLLKTKPSAVEAIPNGLNSEDLKNMDEQGSLIRNTVKQKLEQYLTALPH